MGTFNAQQSNPMKSNNKNNNQLNNMPGMLMPGMPPGLSPQPCFMNFPNQFLPLQNNNQLGMPQLGQVNPVLFPGQPFVGFIPQGGLPNSNNGGGFNMPRPFGNMSQMNPSPMPGQFFPQNLMNLSQQNMNQLMAMQMSNPNQFGMFSIPSSHQMLGCLNQVSQAMGPQSAPFVANPQFGMVYSSDITRGVNPSQTNFVQPSNGVNASPSNTASAQQGNITMLPGNRVNGGNNTPNSKWKNSPGKNFKGNPKNDRFQKSQFHQKKNFKKNFGGFQENGASNDRVTNGFASSFNQAKQPQKRSLSLNYTEQEIQLWREQRRKNYPSTANAQKKLSENPTNTEAFGQEAKLRREQLKEILTKQAELGVEVAEVPSHYLSDSENQPRGGKEDNKRGRRERFQNKGNKRRRYDKREKFANKQHQADNNSSSRTSCVNIRKPTLLEKLLSADIRRDRSRLLQVFRFMVMNSFFKDLPEKPLKFPVVVVQDSADISKNSTMSGGSCAGASSVAKDSGCEVQDVVNKSLLVEECTHNDSAETRIGEIYDEHDDNIDSDNEDDNDNADDVADDDNNDDDDNDVENKTQGEREGYFVSGEGGNMSVVEEEGEIVE